MRLEGFVGPFNRAKSRNVDAEDTINLVIEKADAGLPRVPGALYKAPCVTPYIGLGSGPVRNLYSLDGKMFALAGAWFFEIFGNGTAVVRGNVALDSTPGTIVGNGLIQGHQILVLSGGYGYIYDTIDFTFTQITAEGFPYPAQMGGFLDGFFVVLQRGNSSFQISSLYNGLEWDALDIGQVNQSADAVLAMHIDHREIWLMGSRTSVPWVNNGDADFPFAPVQGVFVQQGIAGVYSVGKLDNSLFFIGQDENGRGVVYRLDGYRPARISTHAVEHALQQLTRLDDAIAWTCQIRGHLFYMLYLPTSDYTWGYDVATGEWERFGLWDTNQIKFVPHVGRCHCFAFGKHFVGDRSTSTIYELRDDLLVDTLVAA